MNQKNNFVYIYDIVEHIDYALQFVDGFTFKDFCNDKEKEFAVIRCVEVVGEATKRIELNFRKKYPALPWKEMAAIRDVLAHNYDGLELKIL